MKAREGRLSVTHPHTCDLAEDGIAEMPTQMRQNEKILVLLPCDELFSDGPVAFNGFKELLQPLSRADVLFWCARLNLLLCDPQTPHARQQQQCVELLFPEQEAKINDYAARHGGVDSIVIVYRGALH